MQNAAVFLPRTNSMRIYVQSNIFTLTGRVSMSELNIQNIPKKISIDEHTVCNTRMAIVAMKNFVILAADYSQLELRILAHLSNDKNLLDSLNSGSGIIMLII